MTKSLWGFTAAMARAQMFRAWRQSVAKDRAALKA
jgi:hypothetical protein